MITLRPLDLPDDLSALGRLDTSFSTERVYRLERTAHAVSLVESHVTPPRQKTYSLDDLSTLDWVRVAVDGPEVIGLAALRLDGWNRRAVLHHLYVSPTARGGGVGRALVAAAEGEALHRGARVLWAETQSVNFGAVQFYERLGFTWCGFDTSLYDPSVVAPDEVALFFARSLTS